MNLIPDVYITIHVSVYHVQVIDTVWLSSSKYVGGTEEISIADLLLCGEIAQLCLLNATETGPTMEELLGPHANLRAWLDRVRASCAPHYEDVHKMLWRMSKGASSTSSSRSKI